MLNLNKMLNGTKMRKKLKRAVDYFNKAEAALSDKNDDLVSRYQHQAYDELNKVKTKILKDKVNYIKALYGCRFAYLYILQSKNEAAHQQFDLAFSALNTIAQEKIAPTKRVYFAQAHYSEALKYNEDKQYSKARDTIEQASLLIENIPEKHKTSDHHLLEFHYKAFSSLLELYMGKITQTIYMSKMQELSSQYFKGRWSIMSINNPVKYADEATKAQTMIGDLLAELDAIPSQHSIFTLLSREPAHNSMPSKNARISFN
jgi:hypothetical protein